MNKIKLANKMGLSQLIIKSLKGQQVSENEVYAIIHKDLAMELQYLAPIPVARLSLVQKNSKRLSSLILSERKQRKRFRSINLLSA